MKKLVLLLLIIIVSLAKVKAQNIVPLTDTAIATIKITNIQITGNKRTKPYIIFREIPFKIGDSLPKNQLAKILTQAKTQVYNTNLFAEVNVDTLQITDTALQLQVRVIERFYVYPIPQFQLADRSFSEWIKTYNADLNRVIYGLKFVHYNFSGRRDQLRVTVLNGYARNIAASYSAPYSNKTLTEGFAIGAGFTQNREVGYKTNSDNRILNFRKTGFIRNNISFGASYNRRKGYFLNKFISLNLNHVKVDDSIITPTYNPNYFNKNTNKLLITDVTIGASYNNNDNINYPQKGLNYGFNLSKRGLGFSGGINSTTLSANYSKYIPHNHNFFSTIQTAAVLRVPFKQAYINQRAIGYGSLNLRGLEVYVVDGVAAAVAKYTLTKKLAAFKLPLPFKIQKIPYIPFKFYLKTFTDVGYSYNSKQFNTTLNNKLLYTGGFGLDVVTLYDIVVKIEYSFNQLGQKGLFLHGNGGL